MNEVSAGKLADILCRDPLYSDRNIALNVTHYISSRNCIKLHFFGYLYGVGSRPIANAPRSMKYTGKSTDIEPCDPQSVNNLIPFCQRTLDGILECKDILSSVDANDINAVSEVVQKCADRRREANEANDVYVHLVASFLATGLAFSCFEKTNQFNAPQLVYFLDAMDGCCLMDILPIIKLSEHNIREFFSKELLPLPSELYPARKHNTLQFLEKFPSGGWDKCDPTGDFEIFYDSAKENISASSLETNNTDQTVRGLDVFDNGKSEYEFYQSGQYWVVTFKGERDDLRHTKGMMFIHNIIKAGRDGISIGELDMIAGGHVIDRDDRRFDQESNLSKTPEDVAINSDSCSKMGRGISKMLESIDEEQVKIENNYNDGRITYEDYEESLKNLKKAKNDVYRTNKVLPDKNNKRIYENVTKAINSAMKVIEFENKDLYEHLRDATVPKRRVFCYANHDNIKWKLFG